MFDMACNVELGALFFRAPIEQQGAATHARYRRRQRHLLVEIENSRRIDQRGHENRGCAFPAMVAKTCALDARQLRLVCMPRTALGLLISAQACKRFMCKLAILLRHAPYQFEKQRKWAWRMLVCGFMLQRTMLR